MATLRVKKTKGGDIYFVDFVINGKRRRTSTKTGDRKLAELFLKDIEVKIAKNKFGFDDLNKKILLSKFSEKYLQFSKATKADNSYSLDERYLGYLLKFLKDIQLDKITSKDIEEYKVHRVNEVKPVSVNIEIRHLKAAFEKAVQWGYIDKNPVKGIKQLRVKNSNLPKFLTKEEIDRLLETVTDVLFKKLIYFYLYTGCRRGEILRLTWDDINMATKKITINETKSGFSRVVPINAKLFDILNTMEPNGSKVFPYLSDFVTKKFKKYLKASEIKNYEALNVHSLRHTFASHLIMAGVDICTVSKLLGHSSVRVTEMYAHLVPDHLKASVERLQY